jgi:ribosomal RNA assembly protein
VEKKTYIRIPSARIGPLIGPDGRDKEQIERLLKVDLKIESDTGNIEVLVRPEQMDVSVIFTAANVVKAIGRGFSPQRALALMQEDSDLIILEIEDYVGTSKNAQNRVKGRVIGRGGKSRAMIEELTGCYISVYGDTISIIGPFDALPSAREAIVMLINGAFHKTVWNFLYAYRRKLKQNRAKIWYESGM